MEKTENNGVRLESSTMAARYDLENNILPNSSFVGISGATSETSIMGNSSLANSSFVGISGTTSETSILPVGEKAGGAEVERNLFKNIWHEYLFIFLVTSAQLITVSYYYITVFCHDHIELMIGNATYSKPIWETQLFR